MLEAFVLALDIFVNSSIVPDWLAKHDNEDLTETTCEEKRQSRCIHKVNARIS